MIEINVTGRSLPVAVAGFPSPVPRHNGKVERYQRILAEEFLYARERTSDSQRSKALQIWNIHYHYHRPHTAAGNRPPASRLHTGVTNVTASYT